MPASLDEVRGFKYLWNYIKLLFKIVVQPRVQQYFTSEIKVLWMLLARCATEKRKISLKQHTEVQNPLGPFCRIYTGWLMSATGLVWLWFECSTHPAQLLSPFCQPLSAKAESGRLEYPKSKSTQHSYRPDESPCRIECSMTCLWFTWRKTWTSGRSQPWRSVCRACAPWPARGRWSWIWAASAGWHWPARPLSAPRTSARSALSRLPNEVKMKSELVSHYTGWFICSETMVELTLTWMFHYLAQLHRQFCQTLICQSRTGQTVEWLRQSQPNPGSRPPAPPCNDYI